MALNMKPKARETNVNIKYHGQNKEIKRSQNVVRTVQSLIVGMTHIQERLYIGAITLSHHQHIGRQVMATARDMALSVETGLEVMRLGAEHARIMAALVCG